MEIIPAIDLIDGKCVRLTRGDYNRKTIYNEHPLEVALQFEDAGLRRLHLVDLDGAKAGKVINQKVLEKIATKTDLVIDFGGGIKSNDDIQSIFNAGAAMATIGSVAVKNEILFNQWLTQYGGEKIFLGADVKEEKIVIHGWTEETELKIFDFLKKNLQNGLRQAFCTDVSKDGVLKGPAVSLYKKILAQSPTLQFTASGGVAQLQDLKELESIGCHGTIVGKAIYEGRITLNELTKWMEKDF